MTTTTSTDDPLARARQCRELGEYAAAQQILDRMLDDDPHDCVAWYEKSTLPIVQRDDVALRGRTVSLSRYLPLDPAGRRDYLQRCGYEVPELPAVQARLSIPRLVADQRIRYLTRALREAPPEQAGPYSAELAQVSALAAHDERHDRTLSVTLGLIALAVCVAGAIAVGVAAVAGAVPAVVWVVPAVAACFILAVVGMTTYVRAAGRGHATALALVANLLALIVANATVIAVVVLLIARA